MFVKGEWLSSMYLPAIYFLSTELFEGVKLSDGSNLYPGSKQVHRDIESFVFCLQIHVSKMLEQT